jgi:cytochrome c-type biogenesis protein CcmH/NrfF
MTSFIAKALAERRTLEQAVADLRAGNALELRPEVTEMIRHGEAEIRDRMMAGRYPDAVDPALSVSCATAAA